MLLLIYSDPDPLYYAIAKYCDLRLPCLYVYLLFRLFNRTHHLKYHSFKFTKFALSILPVAVARSSLDGNAIHCVFPVL